jgi:hypothetical protein
MLEKGIVQSMDEAFDRYLGRGKPAYIEKPVIPVQAAIDIIRSVGGISVLAHPGLIETKNSRQIDELIAELVSLGLNGIEVFYPNHTYSQTSCFARLAEKFNLLVTGGTDFHGAISPDIALGIGRGNFSVPFGIYETLKNALNH